MGKLFTLPIGYCWTPEIEQICFRGCLSEIISDIIEKLHYREVTKDTVENAVFLLSRFAFHCPFLAGDLLLICV